MTVPFVDALIVGGGPAGLSCALALARGGRHVVICDEGHPRNERAQVMHNFPAMDGINPAEFLERIRENLKSYPEIKTIHNRVVDITKEENSFQSRLENGDIIKSKKVILAEGLKDTLPDIPGVREGWGRSVFQCPYCHAYESKGDGIGILADEKTVFHVAKLLLGLTRDLIVFTNGHPLLDNVDKKIMGENGIIVYEEKIDSLVMEGDKLTGIKLISGKIVPRKALFIKPDSKIPSDLGVRLGCALTDNGTFETNELCKSCVPGVFIAGDASSKTHSVLQACAEGSKAGLNVNFEILEEEFEACRF
jgi:thioredoxin reductase